jgi:hypothetical protein
MAKVSTRPTLCRRNFWCNLIRGRGGDVCRGVHATVSAFWLKFGLLGMNASRYFEVSVEDQDQNPFSRLQRVERVF